LESIITDFDLGTEEKAIKVSNLSKSYKTKVAKKSDSSKILEEEKVIDVSFELEKN